MHFNYFLTDLVYRSTAVSLFQELMELTVCVYNSKLRPYYFVSKFKMINTEEKEQKILML